jgi:hypothetical protein
MSEDTQVKAPEENRAKECAKSTLEYVMELLKEFHQALKREESLEKEDKKVKANDEPNENSDGVEQTSEEIRERIESSAYAIDVTRHYSLLLAGGGPSVRITGELDEHGGPETARLQYQDWFTPWEDLHLIPEERDALLEFVSMYYFPSTNENR